MINVGSTAAFNAIISLTTAGLFSSYEIAIVLILLKKLKREPIPYGPWTLGRLGIPINIASICFLTIVIFFSFFPEELPVTPVNMNWSIVVFSGEFLLGLAWYVVRGRKVYHGPIIEAGLMPLDTGFAGGGKSGVRIALCMMPAGTGGINSVHCSFKTEPFVDNMLFPSSY